MLLYNAAMNDKQANHKQDKQSPKKLTFLFILLPILVVALMVVFWVIFQQTRKHVTAAIDVPVTFQVAQTTSQYQASFEFIHSVS